MKLATLLAATCCLATLTPMAGAQAVFNFDSNANGTITDTTNPIGTNFAGNTEHGFINDIDSTFLNADMETHVAGGPTTPTTLNLSTTNTVDAGFMPSTTFRFVPNGAPPFGTNLAGNILEKEDGLPNDVLHLHFNNAISSIVVAFAIVPNSFDGNGNPITGAGGANITSSLTLGADSASGTLNGVSGDFEGSLQMVGSPSFNDIALSFSLDAGSDFGFAIDTITVTPAATISVPEPGAVAFALAGLAPVVGLLRRRRSR